MEPSKPQRIVLLILGGFMLAAWALVIWAAYIITLQALDTLNYIVELAQLS